MDKPAQGRPVKKPESLNPQANKKGGLIEKWPVLFLQVQI